MKKIINLIMPLFILLVLPACNNDDKDVQELYPVQELKISFIEYGTLPADSEPAINKYFTIDNPARNFIPTWLESKKIQTGNGSTSLVSYDYKGAARSEDLAKLSQEVDKLEYSDYKNVWGIPWVESFTPNKEPETHIATILNNRYPNAEQGEYKIVDYFYSDKEPELTPNVTLNYLDETFTGLESERDYHKFGWLNISANATRRWVARTWSGTYRAMYTANGQAFGKKMDAWLISKELDLSAAVNPKFTFELAAGYFSIHCLSVLISDSYDEKSNPTVAEWKDLTDLFDIPRTGPAGYGNMKSVGEISLQKYVGKKVRIAYRFTGFVDPILGYGTTYELDNINISEKGDLFSVENAKKQTRLFTRNGSGWEIGDQEDIYILQDDDYELIQVQTIDANYADKILLSFLKKKFPSPVAGKTLVLVYNTGKKVLSTDEFMFVEGRWIQSSDPAIMVKQDKYIYSSDGNTWRFVSEE